MEILLSSATHQLLSFNLEADDLGFLAKEQKAAREKPVDVKFDLFSGG